ncbi:MAG: IS110 family transposase [Parvibaculaceae bacterium]|nr:IS110 family transposase [Parvibaculaceae bacterium]
MTEHNIGVDISKSYLDIYNLSTGASGQFDNNPDGFMALAKWLPKEGLRRIVFEPTGPYHRAFSLALGSKFPLVKVNPLQARRFAQACGVRAKTDAVDARMLAQMGAAFNLDPDREPSQEALILKELRVARLALTKQSTRLKNRLKILTVPLLKRQAGKQAVLVKNQITEIDAEIGMQMSQDQTTARNMDILCSVPGLGKVSAAALLIEMPELGKLGRKQVASLSGLAPINRESGQWRGKAFIQGGRKPLRDALYMPAIVAMRHNPDLKRKYQTMVAAGKPPKVAIIALMRKLIELANTLIKNDRKWTQNRA